MFASNTSQVSGDANYIEDVFSTYLYTGNGSTQTITNGIDLAGKGGLWWGKQRNSTGQHWLLDSARAGNIISTNLTDAQTVAFASSPFTSTGISFTSANSIYNGNGNTYVGGTFREQAKFFDVVTYTGNGAASQTINHNLGSTPGCIIVKRTNLTTNWEVYHRSLGATKFIWLNSTAAEQTSSARWNNTSPTSTQFTVGSSDNVNGSGGTYVAYLFAHNAGGFGLTGTDNVISCGSYTGNGSTTGPVIDLGYEPQWILLKHSSGSGSAWFLLDNMRGVTADGLDQRLFANESSAEGSDTRIAFNATGFQPRSGSPEVNQDGQTYIYIAIRRGPMKVPTSGTSVFAPVARTGTGSVASVTTPGFPVDMTMIDDRLGYRTLFFDKLRGANQYITSVNTSAETTYTGNNGVQGFLNTGFILGADTDGYVNFSGDAYINWCFRRAPGFFDEVCYTGNGPGTQVISHNLAVAPELSIFKARSGTGGWTVYNGATQFLRLNETAAGATDGNISPTVTSVTVSSSLGFGFNASGVTYVAYLFASCPGVSKCGSYTGTGTTQQINCGFTGGARFVLIKRTDSTGDWVLWDSSRGMVAGTDPRLALNSTAAEVNQNWVYATTGGFEIVTSDAAVNASGGSYIFLSVA